MSALSDSSVHEDEHDIVAEYENQDSEEDRGNGNFREDEAEVEEEDDGKQTGRRIDPGTSRKHIVKNPQPKLDTLRLKGPKGLLAIEKYFEGFKFHGKGHEKTDLDRIMKRMEHWGHRLFPKLDFDDFLAKVEHLGNKKDLKVFVTKYRLDMIDPDSEFVTEIIEDAEEDKEEEGGPIDELDMLIGEQIEKQKQISVMQEASTSAESTANRASEAFDQLMAGTSQKNSQPVKENNSPSQLSDEVKARIERNRQQAIQRRLARLNALKEEEEAKKKKTEESESQSNNGVNSDQKDSEDNSQELQGQENKDRSISEASEHA